MTARDYERLFAKSVRVAVNWRAVRKANPRVETIVVDSLATMGVPWYRNGEWHADVRDRIIVEEAASLVHSDNKHRMRILGLAVGFLDTRPAPFTFPAIQSNDEVFLLDGTHRAIALELSRVEFSALLCVMHVPKTLAPAFFDI